MADNCFKENIYPNKKCSCEKPIICNGLHPLIEWCARCGKSA